MTKRVPWSQVGYMHKSVVVLTIWTCHLLIKWIYILFVEKCLQRLNQVESQENQTEEGIKYYMRYKCFVSMNNHLWNGEHCVAFLFNYSSMGGCSWPSKNVFYKTISSSWSLLTAMHFTMFAFYLRSDLCSPLAGLMSLRVKTRQKMTRKEPVPLKI